MAVPDPFEFWRLFWQNSPVRSIEPFVDALAEGAGLAARVFETPSEAPEFFLLNHVRLDLPTMALREPDHNVHPKHPPCTLPTLIVAPFAVHDATIADFSAGHSLAQTLLDAGIWPLALTHWTSATPDMRFFTIDSYFSDLNVAIDDLGGRVVLVGLCQGGWLAAAFAARFPHKVAALVLAGTPIDVTAAESGITKAVAALSAPVLANMIRMAGGRALGRMALALWSQGFPVRYNPADALQCEPDAALRDKFLAWNETVVDLPGPYFLQTTEWLFRENRLAHQCFPVLGRVCDLQTITAPVFVLAAAQDEIIALPQVLAAKDICRAAVVTTRIEQGNHLSLFMGQHTLCSAWREIARWIRKSIAHNNIAVRLR